MDNKVVLTAVLLFSVVVYANSSSPLSYEAPLQFSSNTTKRDFLPCSGICSGGLECCCAQINGQQACMTNTTKDVFYCFNTSLYQCCNYVPNSAYQMLACASPLHCVSDTTQPSGNICASASTIFLSSFAVLTSVFVLLF